MKVLYKCEKCLYQTDRLLNFKRHEKRKTPCDTRMIVTPTNIIDGQNIIHDGQNIVHEGQNIIHYGQNIVHTASFYYCNRCNKKLSDQRSYVRHIEICKGYNSKTCGRCLKQFSSYQARWKHMRIVKCTPPSQVTKVSSPIHLSSIINNNSNNNNNNTINNTINNTNNVNIQLNFGEELLEKLCNQPDYIERMEKLVRLGKYALPQHISDIYFNDSYPLNNTIQKTSKKDRFVKIKTGENEWNLRAMDDVYKTLIDRMESYMTPYFVHVEKQMERVYDQNRKKFKQMTENIREFGHKVLWLDWKCDDIRQIGVELNEPYCDNERRRRINEMKKMLLEHIYDKTRELLFKLQD